MDFDLSDEQRLLKDSVSQMLADRYTFEARKASIAAPHGFNPDIWRQIAELGLLAVPFDEAHGGIGGGAQETMIVMQAFGTALVVEPYFASVVLAGGAIRHAASDVQKAALLPALIDGTTRFALAHAERQSRYDLHVVELTAAKDGAGYVLNGAKSLVLNGDSADTLIVLARTAGGARDRAGLGLFVVDAKTPGVSRRGYPTQDGCRAAEITFEQVRVAADAVLGDPAAAIGPMERIADEAMAALTAEAVGCMDEMLRQTVDYMKTRKQFGTTIGAFQALQHKASDMFVATEQARSMALLAAMMVTEPDANERAKALSAAKVQIGRSGKFVSQAAVQLFGGVGVTMEYAIGHYMKRLAMIETQFGDADHHLSLLADRVAA
jgi:pimeloyl-CoA dehydrogenase small subunit